jgi:hypothetical protein
METWLHVYVHDYKFCHDCARDRDHGRGYARIYAFFLTRQQELYSLGRFLCQTQDHGYGFMDCHLTLFNTHAFCLNSL